jgi:hypothetical protein
MEMKDVAKIAIGVAAVGGAVASAASAGVLPAIGAGCAALMSWAVGVTQDYKSVKTMFDKRGQAIDSEDPK